MASERLKELLGQENLVFSPARRSAPINFGLSDDPFTDVVVVGRTTLEKEAVTQLLKKLEHEVGRTPEQRDTHPEVIPVDIDLITWERELLKPKDIDRPYLIEGLRELREPLFATED